MPYNPDIVPKEGTLPPGSNPLELIGPVIEGGLNYLSTRDQNKQTRKENVKNRNFQERMRNTQWQASVADLRAAGLNPALAYQQGPAASPSGSNGGSIQNPMANVMSSARQYMRFGEEMKNLRADTLLKSANAGESVARKDKLAPGSEGGRILRDVIQSPEGAVGKGVDWMRRWSNGLFGPLDRAVQRGLQNWRARRDGWNPIKNEEGVTTGWRRGR